MSGAGPASAPALALAGVTVRYAGAGAVVDDVTLRVERGATVALIGSSGAGKSTILRALVGLEAPAQGVVRVGGEDPAGPARLAVQRRIGYVIQDGGLFPHLSARDNVTLVARKAGVAAGSIAARVDELAALVQLPADALARFPHQLSGGQRQRVALMRALMLDPDVLLLDEPLAALDPITRADLQEGLRAIFAALAKTVVLVTHDVGEAAFLAPRLVMLASGRIVADGTLAALRAAGDPFVQRFLHAQRVPPDDGAAAAEPRA